MTATTVHPAPLLAQDLREQLFSGVRKQTLILGAQVRAMQEQVDHLEELLAMLSTPELPTAEIAAIAAAAPVFCTCGDLQTSHAGGTGKCINVKCRCQGFRAVGESSPG